MKTTAINLRCESRINPLAIESPAPRLGWQLESAQRDQRQTSYRILVASSPGLLAADTGDLWDSGEIVSTDTLHIPYAGAPLTPAMRCFWKVRTRGVSSDAPLWSEPAFWEMAPSAQSWMDARWISLDPVGDDERLPLARSLWISPEDARASDPDRMLCFRCSFDLPPDAGVRSATLTIAAEGNFVSWINQARYMVAVNGRTDPRWSAQTTVRCPSQWDVASALIRGGNSIALISAAGPDNAVILHCTITLDNGDTVTVATDGKWKCDISPAGMRDIPPEWLKETCDDTGWPHAREIAPFGDGPWDADSPRRGIDRLIPPACLRKTFILTKAVSRARLHSTAAGIYEVRVNAMRAGDDLLAPGWTDYPRRLLYQSYDVTALLRSGVNVLGATVADGWFSGNVGLWKTYRHLYGYRKGLLCRLEITYEDGTTESVVTDTSWKGATGPIRYSDMFDGETRDNRRELPGWDRHGFDDSTWRTATLFTPEVGALEPQSAPPVRKTGELPALNITEPAPGVFIADMGQNMVGRIRIRLKGPAGTVIVLRHGELLKGDGTLFTGNLMRARCTDTCILRGDPDGETFEPCFTFHGFRYVEITGVPSAPVPADITGIIIHSDLPVTGRFECSDPMLNRLQANIVWSQRGNFVAIPTDCPQRSERVGWAGDAQAFAPTASFNMDTSLFFHSWLIDLMNHQRPDGAVADAVPSKDVGYGNFGWGDAIAIIPWNLYVTSGDRTVLETFYPAMTKWIGFLLATSDNHIRSPGGWGDWLSPGTKTPNNVVATAFFAHTAKLVSLCARVIGRNLDAIRYETLFHDVKKAFNQAFVRPDGSIESDTQTAYALAIRFGLVDRKKSAPHLDALIKKADHTIGTGFLGIAHLLPALTHAGLTDTAYRLVLSTRYPSWGHSISKGATTIWERWDGCDPDGPPEKRGELSSLNHYTFGSVGEWLYSTVGGLQTDELAPGYTHVIMHPVPNERCTWAKTEYASIRGTIGCAWKVENGVFSLDAVVPAGVTATVHMPGTDPESVTESGKPAHQSEGVHFEGVRNGHAVYRVGSGRYSFVSRNGGGGE